ncbi:MAG: hypothetical protein ACI86M_003103 [Saprospiraceae bacterium]
MGYEPLGIVFDVCVIDYPCSTCKQSQAFLTQLWNNETPDDALNGFFFGGNDLPASPQAQSIPSKNFSARVELENIIHEIGHCFGLLHTHQSVNCGLQSGEYAPTISNGSLVFGANSDTAGDQIQDTPADPRNCYSPTVSNCIFQSSSTVKDFLDNPYIDPDNVLPINYMSYNSICREDFTPMQILRMKDMITAAIELNGITTSYSIEERIDTDISWSGNKYFNDNIYVSPGAHLTITGDVKFTQGKGIIVEPNGSLTVSGGSLDLDPGESCNPTIDQLWMGIIAENNGSDKAYITIVQGSTISNAECAIDVVGGGQKWTFVKDSYFTNNKVTYRDIANDGGACSWRNTDITIDNNYIPSSYFPQVRIINSPTISAFVNCNFNANTTTNINLVRQALSCFNSSLYASTCSFHNWTQGLNISGSTSKVGYINNTTFDENIKAMNSESWINLTVKNSTFDISNPSPQQRYGLLTTGGRAANVNNTTFTSTESGDITGIFAFGTGPVANVWSENTFSSLETGLYATGCGNQFRGLMLLCSDNSKNTEYDFNNEYGISPFQGASSKPAGNTFSQSGNNSDSDFRAFGNAYLVDYYYSTVTALENPVEYSGINPLPEAMSSNCLPTFVAYPPLTPDVLADYETFDNSNQNDIDNEKNNINQNTDNGDTPRTIAYIQNNAQSNPTLVTNQLAAMNGWLGLESTETFVDHIQYFTEGQVVDIVSANPFILHYAAMYNVVYNGSQPFSQASMNTINAALSTADSRRNTESRLNYYQTLKTVNINNAIVYILLQDVVDYTAYRLWLSKYNTYHSDLMIAESHMDEKDYTEALNKLNSIANTRSLDIADLNDLSDYTDVTNLRIALYNDDRYEGLLTVTELSYLENIANTSAYFAGDQARVWLTYFYGQSYPTNFSQSHTRSKVELAQNTTSVTTLKVFPNPASQYLNIKGTHSPSDRYEIRNITGHVIKEGRLNTTRIDIGGLESAVYTISVSNNFETKFTKFIKI